jgi:hypothetical protein
MGAFTSLGIPPEPVADVIIPFGEWLPDMPEENNPGAIEALNVIPSEGCYIPFKELGRITGLTLPEQVVSGIRLYNKTDSAVLYAGTREGVYVRVASSFVQVYDAPYTLFYENLWQFVQFGQFVVALHPQVVPQVGNVGEGVAFTPLGGSPPIAAVGGRVGDFLVLGNLFSEDDPDGARQPQRIRWSGFNNIESPWITDPSTQADFNDMPAEGGQVMAITGREFGSVFQARSISRMTYVGLPAVFDIETVETERGAISSGCVVDIGSLVYFIAEDGFAVWNGTNSLPIGDNKVNRYFFRKLNWKKRALIQSAIDPVHNCIVWAFPTDDSGFLKEIMVYSYKENRFSHSIQGIAALVSGTPFGVSLDDMTGNLDTDYPISFDDSFYGDGRVTLGGFDVTSTFGLFDGDNLPATMDTAENSGPSQRRVFVNSARPIVDTALATSFITTLRRDQLSGGALITDPPVGQEITGECSVFSDARYTRFRLDVIAGETWNHARGIQVYRKATGKV